MMEGSVLLQTVIEKFHGKNQQFAFQLLSVFLLLA